MLLFPADGLRALGLGEARVNSYLGQPLDITIRLIEADADALDSLTAQPASAADYERLGVPDGARGLGLDVSVDRRSDPPLLRVTSRRAASDPVLRFMIDARWASGRLLREYTVFLDPPTYEVAPPVTRREAEPPAVAEPEPAPRERPAPDRPVRPAEPAPAPEPEPRPAPGPEVVGPVAAGQTLWGIAYDWRPDTNLTMSQVMLAILERNPQAFRDNNINRLLRGSELTMPDIDEVRALSAREADRRMQAQMQAWRERAPERREVPVVAEEAVPEVESPREAPTETAVDPEVVHRLEVVPPDSDLYDEGQAVSDGEIQRASRRLSELEDRMYDEGLESDELFRQIENIREAIDSREAAGMAVADEELAVLESRLRQARLARLDIRQRVVEPDADDDAVSDYFRELEEEFADSDDALAVAETDPAVTDERITEPRPDPADEIVPEPEPAEVPAATEADPTGLPWWLWLVAALVVIGLAGAVLFVLRQRASTDMQSAPTTGRRSAGAVESARKRVAADPKNLTAHLALIRALADRDDNERFAEALDDMYRQVDNDEHSAWQEALNLAVTHAPDHPLLTPPEQRNDDDGDDDEGLDDRTREMLGILEGGEEERPAPDDYELGSDVEPGAEVGGEEFFATDDDSDDAEVAESPDTRLMGDDESDSADEDNEIGEDLDLAELSNRLDDPALATREPDRFDSSDEDELDIAEFEVEDDQETAEDIFTEETADGKDEADMDEESDRELDFEFSSTSDEDVKSTDEPDEQKLERSKDVEPTSESVEASTDDAGMDDLELDVDDDLALPDDDESLSKSDQPKVEVEPSEVEPPEVESPEETDGSDREFEAFLAGDGDDEAEAPESGGPGQDQGEPELSDEDAEVKLDLARAYLSMDDPESARALLEEITSGGSAAMREQAAKLLDDL